MPPTPRLDPLTTETIPQPMRPEPDLGMPPKVEPEQNNGQWQVPEQGSAIIFGPFQDHPILPKERTLKAKTKQRQKNIYIYIWVTGSIHDESR